VTRLTPPPRTTRIDEGQYGKFPEHPDARLPGWRKSGLCQIRRPVAPQGAVNPRGMNPHKFSYIYVFVRTSVIAVCCTGQRILLLSSTHPLDITFELDSQFVTQLHGLRRAEATPLGVGVILDGFPAPQRNRFRGCDSFY
jgi:hypothetical protein